MKKMIKASALMLTLVLSLIVVSCGKNDEVSKVCGIFDKTAEYLGQVANGNPEASIDALKTIGELKDYYSSTTELTQDDRDALAKSLCGIIKATGNDVPESLMVAGLNQYSTLGQVVSTFGEGFAEGL